MRILFIAVTILFISANSYAQHQGHHHTTDTTKKLAPNKSPAKKKTTHQGTHQPVTDTTMSKTQNGKGHDHSTHDHADHGNHNMSHAFSRNLPMTRNGSGTSWQPDNSPMYGYMFHSGKWMYMLHGNLFLRYNKQDIFDHGSRGDEKFDAPNMWMFMGQRNLGAKGLFHFNSMISLDPITVGGEGYPLLFQTGETYKDSPLIDRQHPHDLFSELSVSYSHMLSDKSDLFVYLAYPGEPALGPSAFVHRPSGFMNPDAPLTHHWVDATHISFGVATLGFRYGKLKIEASSFTGREPDENRYNFDKPKFDSWSGRISFNPSPEWALQVSHGFINEPEELHPGEDVNRSTASVQYSHRGFGESFTNITALWGMNKTRDHAGEHGILVEGSRQIKRKTFYSRYEFVQKSAEELGFSETEFGHDAVFPTHAITVGGSYDILQVGQTKLAIGGQATIYSPDKKLSDVYGDNPVAGEIYLRIYPRVMGQKSGRFYLPY